MTFQNVDFLIWLAGLLFLFSLLPNTFKASVLLLFSIAYYTSFKGSFAIYLITSIAINYIAAKIIDGRPAGMLRKVYLLIAVTLNLSLLLYFKFLSQFLWNSTSPFDSINIIIPIGISFYTFQAISYLADVYKKIIPAERSIIYFSLYLSFFPQILAGPIERANKLIPQLKELRAIKLSDLSIGSKVFLWGLFKKVLIADKFAMIANPIFESPDLFTGAIIMVGILSYSIQIYCDFSGYCDMAIGLAKVFGIDLTQNFISPYHSASFGEFWSRWHITLSGWFKQYVYIPLGGNRVNTSKWGFNLLIVFLLSGLWHGSSINFLIWGFLHFTYYILEKVICRGVPNFKFPRLLKQVIVFILVSFAWIFFRANSFPCSIVMIENLFTAPFLNIELQESLLIIGSYIKLNWIQVISIIIPFSVFLFYEVLGLQTSFYKTMAPGNVSYTWLWFVNFLIVSLLFFSGGYNQQFIYFQF